MQPNLMNLSNDQTCRLFTGIMSEGAAEDPGMVHAMADFFWKTTDNYQMFSNGVYFRDVVGNALGASFATQVLKNTLLITNCHFVDPLELPSPSGVVTIDHRMVPCFLEKKHEEDPRTATRIYFNPESKHFVSVHVVYEGNDAPGPFSGTAKFKFYRVYPACVHAPYEIFEILSTLLCPDIEPPEILQSTYRPVH